MKTFDVTIHRKRKHEAEQAIRDLEARGFVKVTELTNKKEDRKIFASAGYKKVKFQEAALWDSWQCRMRKVVNDCGQSAEG